MQQIKCRKKNSFLIKKKKDLCLGACKFSVNNHIPTNQVYLVFILMRISSIWARRKDIVFFICHISTGCWNNRFYFSASVYTHLSQRALLSSWHQVVQPQTQVEVMTLKLRHWAHIVTMSTHGSLWTEEKWMPEVEAISKSKQADKQEVTLRRRTKWINLGNQPSLGCLHTTLARDVTQKYLCPLEVAKTGVSWWAFEFYIILV